MYCFCHCASLISRVYYRCVNKHTASVGGYCMTQKHKTSLPLPIYTMLTLAIVGLLASACALSGGSSSNTTSDTSPIPYARSNRAALWTFGCSTTNGGKLVNTERLHHCHC